MEREQNEQVVVFIATKRQELVPVIFPVPPAQADRRLKPRGSGPSTTLSQTPPPSPSNLYLPQAQRVRNSFPSNQGEEEFWGSSQGMPEADQAASAPSWPKLPKTAGLVKGHQEDPLKVSVQTHNFAHAKQLFGDDLTKDL